MSANLPILRENADLVRLFDPATGEEIDLSLCSDATLANLRDMIRDAEDEQRLAKRQIDGAILDRMDHRKKWTLHADGYTLTASSPEPVVEIPDAAALHGELMELVDTGELAVEAVNDAVEQVVTYKPRKRGLQAIKKGGGLAAEIIERHEARVPPTRRVSVKRA